MDVNNNLQKIIYEKDEEQLNETQKDKDIINKETKSKDNIGVIEKGNKESLQKNSEITKNKINNKNNEKETGNKRVNNFINGLNSNVQHNRYYSTITSKNNFRNFVKKANYNKNKDNIEDKNEQNDFNIDNHFNEIRPFSFTAKNNLIKNYYMNKGLDYFLGGTNPNNICNKGFLDNKKSGYNYKNYVRGKRNNYVNKKIFFNQNKIKNLQNINEISQNYFNQNNEDEKQNIINNERENFTRQSYILMNDIINTDNLNINIMNIAGNILNNIGYKDQMVGNNLLLQYLFN